MDLIETLDCILYACVFICVIMLIALIITYKDYRETKKFRNENKNNYKKRGEKWNG
ncbi:hypothetical protein [Flavobacterium sp. 3-210]